MKCIKCLNLKALAEESEAKGKSARFRVLIKSANDSTKIGSNAFALIIKAFSFLSQQFSISIGLIEELVNNKINNGVSISFCVAASFLSRQAEKPRKADGKTAPFFFQTIAKD